MFINTVWVTRMKGRPWKSCTQQGISAKEPQTIDIFSFMLKYIFHFLPGLFLCKVQAKCLFLSRFSYSLYLSMPLFHLNYLNSVLWTKDYLLINAVDFWSQLSVQNTTITILLEAVCLLSWKKIQGDFPYIWGQLNIGTYKTSWTQWEIS